MSGFIHGEPKEWDVEMLENLEAPKDITLIRSLAVSQSTRGDKLCWSYTKSEKYIVKSGYWMARNILNAEF